MPNFADDHADLWGINPQTGKPYTVADRRATLQGRGVPLSMLGGGMSLPSWDRWYDDLATANYERTGKAPNRLNVSLVGGASPEGSNQLRGQSLQTPDRLGRYERQRALAALKALTER